MPGEDWTVLGSEDDPFMNRLRAGATTGTVVDPDNMVMRIPAPVPER